MSVRVPSSTERATIEEIVADYASHTELLTTLLGNLQQAATMGPLKSLVHSIRSRLKDPEHLETKLYRKLASLELGQDFPYSIDNYLEKVNDLAGIRILHLYSRQIKEIDPALRHILLEFNFVLIEGPIARTWDIESRSFFEACGIECMDSRSMYTSVHYVVRANTRKPYTAEIQVRTLSEEVWGETNHAINYPEETGSVPCREQIMALARLTSATTRLVDSVFASHEDHKLRN